MWLRLARACGSPRLWQRLHRRARRFALQAGTRAELRRDELHPSQAAPRHHGPVDVNREWPVPLLQVPAGEQEAQVDLGPGGVCAPSLSARARAGLRLCASIPQTVPQSSRRLPEPWITLQAEEGRVSVGSLAQEFKRRATDDRGASGRTSGRGCYQRQKAQPDFQDGHLLLGVDKVTTYALFIGCGARGTRAPCIAA